MSILDVKRTKQDFLKHKSKSSGNTRAIVLSNLGLNLKTITRYHD